MNSCFETFVGFTSIMSDRLDEIVALKKWCTFSNSIQIMQMNLNFAILIKL